MRPSLSGSDISLHSCVLCIASAYPPRSYDGKMVAASWWSQHKSVAVNGPTMSHGMPPFAWTQFPNAKHQGTPLVYNYTWGNMAPTGW